jgi:DNA-binding Lrp family transcriptional regulator
MPSKSTKARKSTTQTVRERVEKSGARFWTYSDFKGMPPLAVAKALSRLARDGVLRRVSKGVYYRSAPTSFGPSAPSASSVSAKTLHAPLHPAGLSAANVLGLTTQNPRRPEYATPAPAPPSALRDAVVHTGRSPRRAGLSAKDGAILEILRERANSSDLSPEETANRLMRLLADDERFQRLVEVAMTEPPRVRAMLGALGQELNMPARLLERLRKSLNPLTRFDFGRLASLRHADEWQAK